jgi:hypothetical protein
MAVIRKRIDFSKEDSTVLAYRSTWGKKFYAYITYKPRDPLVMHYCRSPKLEEIISYRLEWEATPCNYGGFRYWLLCPSCRSRRRILHLPFYAKYFACRICYNLTYESQQEGYTRWNALFRVMREMPAIERKLRRARSQRTIDKLMRKIGMHNAGLESIIEWDKKQRKKK